MSGFFYQNDPQQQRPYPSTLEDLEELPEDSNQLAPSQYHTQDSTFSALQALPTAGFSQHPEQETGKVPVTASKSQSKPRRRHPPGSDHVKHRRTRSGCYTCRQRRVKCDETRPICDRCSKGSRECTWPEPISATKSSSSSRLSQQKKGEIESGSSSDDYEDEDADLATEGMAESSDSKNINPRRSMSGLKAVARKQSKSSLNQRQTGDGATEQIKEKSLSPSTDEFKSQGNISVSPPPSEKLSTVSSNTTQDDPLFSNLKPDQQFYLNYHQQSLNHNYYFFKQDLASFVHDTLVKAAISYGPLLYAIVGFSAFHYALAQPDGKITDFLGYYNKSVSLLRKALSSGRKHTDSTIFTILQLATFEEYLGDWVNLMGHQKAAHEMIKELYTPESIVENPQSRKLLTWYARFDVYAGLMAGNNTILGHEWLYAHENRARELLALQPDDFGLNMEVLFAHHRILAYEMAQLFSKVPKGEISIPEFLQEHQQFLQKVAAWKENVLSFPSTNEYLVTNFEGSPPLDPDDIVNPYEPGRLYGGPHFVVNYLRLDIIAFEAVISYQTALLLQQPPPPELFNLSLGQCQMFEAIELWPGSPAGAALPAQASLGLLCLSLPCEEKYTSWCKKKLVRMENRGYIYPLSLRSKLAEQWGIPSMKEWWFPNGEQQLPLIRSIRAFIEDRTVKPRTKDNEDVRAMRALLSKLSVDDSPKDSPESSSSIQDSIAPASETGSLHQGFQGSQFQPMVPGHLTEQDSVMTEPGGASEQQNSHEEFSAHWDMSTDR